MKTKSSSQSQLSWFVSDNKTQLLRKKLPLKKCLKLKRKQKENKQKKKNFWWPKS